MYIMLNRISNQVDIRVRISIAGVFINLTWLMFMPCIKGLMRPTEGTGIASANTLCKLLYALISYCYVVYIEYRFNDECPYDGTHALRLYVFPMHHGQTESGVGMTVPLFMCWWRVLVANTPARAPIAW